MVFHCSCNLETIRPNKIDANTPPLLNSSSGDQRVEEIRAHDKGACPLGTGLTLFETQHLCAWLGLAWPSTMGPLLRGAIILGHRKPRSDGC